LPRKGSILPLRDARQKNPVDVSPRSSDHSAMQIAEHVRQKFAELSETAEDDYTSLGRDAGLTRNAMKAIVTGDTAKIDIGAVERFCTARSIPIEEFLGLKDATAQPFASIDRTMFAEVIHLLAAQIRDGYQGTEGRGGFGDPVPGSPGEPELRASEMLLDVLKMVEAGAPSPGPLYWLRGATGQVAVESASVAGKQKVDDRLKG